MAQLDSTKWHKTEDLPTPQSYVCGYCGDKVASRRGYRHQSGDAGIFICPSCGYPSVVDTSVRPGALPGRKIEHLPADIEKAYEETRACLSVHSHTASVLLCRVLLLRIAVEKGLTEKGPSYKRAVEFLAEEGWIGAKDVAWLDKVRVFGNQANHELTEMTEGEARQALDFIAHILTSLYEFRAQAP